ncbi:MAG TPA: dihydrodipicolinate synthase family protein [Rectinemataceae bacterium]|nr:dihydrodipicolinate synthase family protein [Rectinemataceae bacterium]
MKAFDPLVSLRGIVTVLNTPFDREGKVDCAAIARNVEYAIGAGVAGFLVPAMASEVGRLGDDERSLIVERVLEGAGGRVPVVGGASAPTREERRTRARELLAAGCPCVLSAIAWRGEEEYLADLEDLASLDPPCLLVQDWDAVGQGAPLETIMKAFERIPAFRGIKVEVVPAGPKYSALREASGGRMHISGGWAAGQMIEGLDRGLHAFMPTGLHGAYSAIYSRYVSGDREGARALFERILPVLAFSNQHLDISIRFWKRFLWRQGYYPTPAVREPLSPFDEIHLRIADELIERAMLIEDEVLSRPISSPSA